MIVVRANRKSLPQPSPTDVSPNATATTNPPKSPVPSASVKPSPTPIQIPPSNVQPPNSPAPPSAKKRVIRVLSSNAVAKLSELPKDVPLKESQTKAEPAETPKSPRRVVLVNRIAHIKTKL